MASNNRKSWLRRIIYILIGVVIIGGIIWKIVGTPKTSPYTTAKVERGNVSQSVALSGTVEPSHRYQLTFTRSGKIADVKIALGDKVKANDLLATLEKNDVEFQLAAQKANLKTMQANLQKVYAGPRPEEVYLDQLKIQSAQVNANALMVSQQNALNLARSNVNNAAYELQKSQIALNQAQNAYNSLVQNNGMPSSSQNLMSSGPQSFFYNVTQQVGNTNQNPAFQSTLNSIDQYLQQSAQQSQMQQQQQIQDAQRAISVAQVNYQEAQNNYYRTQADLQRQMDEIQGNLAQAGINVASSQQQLNLLTEQPRESDVAALKAEVDQAQQGVNLAQYQVDQSQLKAPEDGVITAINFKKGELVSPAQPLITMDASSYDIKALVSEADIVKLKLAENATITFDALDPNREFHGTVVQISPAETVVQGVVYYETKLQFNSENAPIKPGMTANITINSAEKDNTLMVPTRAIQYENNEAYVQVMHRNDKQEDIEKRKVVIGLQGDENVEVLQGLNEGEEIVTFTKPS